MAAGIPARLTPREGRSFGLTVGGAFLTISALMWWKDHQIPMYITLTLGSLLVLAGLIVPARLGPIFRVWMAFGLAISRVTTPIFMSIVFFLVITPLGLLRRAISGNALIPSRAAQTYWHTRSGNERRSNLKRQF